VITYQGSCMNKDLIENATKAAQCADLLLSDLQSLNKVADAMVSLLVLPEIEKAAGIKARLDAILHAIESK
jgi:hypothetical protein